MRRSRRLRRLVVAWALVLSLTAWAGDSCCCCDCRGVMGAVLAPEAPEVDPVAQEFLRSSAEVAALVGAVSAIELGTALGAPDVQTRWTSTGQKWWVATYTVTGATGSATILVYLRRLEGRWTVLAAESDGGDALHGEVPSDLHTTDPTRRSGGWD